MRRTVRLQGSRWAAAGVAVVTLVWLATSAQAAPLAASSAASAGSGPAPAVAAGLNLGSPSDTGASDVSNLGSGGWKVQSSAVATQTGAQISTPASAPPPGFRSPMTTRVRLARRSRHSRRTDCAPVILPCSR